MNQEKLKDEAKARIAATIYEFELRELQQAHILEILSELSNLATLKRAREIENQERYQREAAPLKRQLALLQAASGLD